MSNGTITKIGNTAAGLGTIVTQPTLDLLTAMGHGNGSGATEEFVTIPGHPRTYNAANFTGATNEAKINAMIARALADGATTASPRLGFIPASMLPYDPSLVTFDTGVHLIREGGTSDLDTWDVQAYGASGAPRVNGNDVYAIQACLDVPENGRKILFPRKPQGSSSLATYLYNRPLQIKYIGTRLIGEGSGRATSTPILQPTFGGSGIFNAVASATLPLETTLYGGAANAMDFTTASGQIQLWPIRDANVAEVNGWSAFCYDTDFKVVGAIAATMSLGGSQGVWLPSDAFAQAWNLFINASNGKLYGTLNLSGGRVTINDAVVLATDTKHHAALSYDGSTVRLLLDGSVVASAAGTGTVVQSLSEDVSLGNLSRVAPEQTFDHFPNQLIQGFARLSTTARYAGSYTPPSKPTTADATTAFLINWETNIGPATKVLSSSNGVAWIVMRKDDAYWGTARIGLEHLTLGGVGTEQSVGLHLLNPTYEPHIANLLCQNMRTAIKHLDGGYMGRFSEIEITADGRGRYGLAVGVLGGILQIDTLIFNAGAGRVGLFLGGSAVVNNMFVQTVRSNLSPDVLPLLCVGMATQTSVVLNNFDVSTENGTDANFRACCGIGGDISVTFVGGLSECGTGSGTQPVAIVDSVTGRVTWIGHGFIKTGSQTSFITSVGTNSCISLVNPHFSHGWTPWSDKAGAVALSGIGKRGAIAFSATPVFDCSVRDEFEITLTGDCAPTITNVTPGQSILVTIIQDGAGAHLFTWPANVKGGGTISATGGSVNQQRFTAMLDSATNPTLMADAAMVSV